MKKLLKISLPLALAFPLIALSCQNNLETKKSINENNSNLTNLNTNKDFNTSAIKELINDYISSDPIKQNEFINNQNNILDAKFNEIKYALTFFVPYILSAEDKAGDFLRLVKESKKIIIDTLQSNWYWYLKNIDKFSFALNPYGDQNKDLDKAKEYILKAQQEFKDLQYINKGNAIDEVYYLPWLTYDKVKKFELYKNKRIAYLFLNDKTVLRAYTYELNNQKVFKLLPDVIYLSDSTSRENSKEILKELEQKMLEKRIKLIEDDVEYERTSDAHPDTVDVNKFYKFYTDKQESDLFNFEAYNDDIARAVLDMFKENKHIYRFTWRWVNEK
ncbi:aromatic motif membrane protein [Mycoplasma struthionis]|uniref:LIPOPROTEIN n=1 Tax=Mycoplasma struthionis TaxID=538220 RepID=A0A3G8LI51_9MOLU|nr:aromatic motif membrane protein [Mycoplasma struthionis]AZG68562.1 hypothetical protein EGN60_01060 [Mycoplasma struthionis]TPI02392.1 hypothetical protein FJM01_00900 [Mycoplasma struthionis]